MGVYMVKNPKKSILDIDQNEQVMHEVKQHKFGLYVLWGITTTAMATCLAVIAFLAGSDFSVISPQINSLLIVISVFAIILLLVWSVIATWIFEQNELIITDENIIEISQRNIFHRDVSQLNLAKIQDVSAKQNGFFANMLGFGTVTVETAGEKANYCFNYCPDANVCAKKIIEAHQEYMKKANVRPSGDGI